MKFLNTINRIVIVILCLALMGMLTALFLMPHITLTSVGQWMVDWGNYLQLQDPWPLTAIGVGLAVVVNVLLLIVIYLEVRSGNRRFIRVQQVAGGLANISTESVTQLLEYRLDPIPGVIRVSPKIRAKGNRVDARVEVGVTRGTNVPQLANRLIKEIQLALTDELGLRIAGQPEVRVTVVSPKGTEAPPPPPTAFKPEPLPETAPEAGAEERVMREEDIDRLVGAETAGEQPEEAESDQA
jgi:uncharacterized alkaline shock family protein YloU